MAIRLYKRTLVSLLGLSVLLGHATITRAQRFTVFDAPNANDTEVRKINNRGDVVGIDFIYPNTVRAFVRDEKGSFTVFDATPQARETDPADINARGEVVGSYIDTSQHNGSHGFVRNPDGDITIFDAPNALMTLGVCINARGEIAGNFVDGAFNFYSYVRDHKGNIVVFKAPDASPTYVAAINDGGDIAGFFDDQSQGGKGRGYIRDRSGSFTVFDMAGTPSIIEETLRESGPITARAERFAALCGPGRGILRSSMRPTHRVRL